MPFRTEEKIFIHQNNYLEFKNLLKNQNAKILYPKRLVHSVYFDNNRSQMYIDSKEGSVIRKKIRVRDYPDTKYNSFNLEIKISSIEGRFKKSKKIKRIEYDTYLKTGYMDNDYGKCMPKLEVSYNREYYLYKNCLRITIDKNILYKKFKKSEKIYKEKLIACEIKSNAVINKSLILNEFPFISHRFSKYASAYQKLYYVN
jgi:hypothetical protein